MTWDPSPRRPMVSEPFRSVSCAKLHRFHICSIVMKTQRICMNSKVSKNFLWFSWCSMFLQSIQSEKGACGRIQCNKSIKLRISMIWVTIFIWTKAPAANLKGNKDIKIMIWHHHPCSRGGYVTMAPLMYRYIFDIFYMSTSIRYMSGSMWPHPPVQYVKQISVH